jgi:hypothetical protein
MRDLINENLICPKHPGTRKQSLRKFGFYKYSGKTYQKYICDNCGHITSSPLSRVRIEILNET